MKRTAITLALLLTAAAAFAEDPYPIAWSRQIGTSATDRSYSVTTDAAGNVYISGYTGGDLAGTHLGGNDAFLVKYDGSGNAQWSRQIGTPVNDYSHAVAVDASGNAYISGYTAGDLGGPTAGGWDAFLTKVDASGHALWSRQIGTGSSDYSYDVAVDAAGNAYVSGPTGGDLGGPSAGGMDAFLTKYDTSGGVLWSRQIGTAAGDYSYGVAVDAAGDAYITGYTSGDLGGTNAGSSDVFLVKFDASGAQLWSRQIGTSASDQSYAVAIDASGNAYISGRSAGSLGGASAGDYDAVLIKYDGAGSLLWSRQVGTVGSDYSRSVAVDAAGNAYITGWTDGDLGGASAGGLDVFLSKFDGLGNLLWSDQIGTSSSDRSYAVAIDPAGNAYISGRTDGSLAGASAGGSDAFLVKYEVPEPATLGLLCLGALSLLKRRCR